MSRITDKEVAAWVVSVAGKIAECYAPTTGKHLLTGRIKGYRKTNILIENDKYSDKTRDLSPDPLPHIPYLLSGSYCADVMLVISRAKMGLWFCVGEVIIDGITAEQMILAKRNNKFSYVGVRSGYDVVAPVVNSRPEAIETAGRNPSAEQDYTKAIETCHPECIYGFCHRGYSGE